MNEMLAGDNEPHLIPEPTAKELQEIDLAFQEATAEEMTGILNSSADIMLMAAEILKIRQERAKQANI